MIYLLFRKIREILFFIFNRHQFGYLGKGTNIFSPLKLSGKKNIFISEYVIIEYKTWLAAIPHTGADKCCLRIGSGTHIGHFNHIYCTQNIDIGKNVLTADKVYISDNLHGYTDITIPILKQPIIQNKEVKIGDGSWLGENVCVLGAKIGRNCVIGANAVVTHDIPDYCVAVGSPAKIIKRYNFENKSWEII